MTASGKPALRRTAAAARNALSDRAARSRAILDALTAQPLYKSCEVLLLYRNFKSEAETDALFSHAVQCGKTVFFPRCIPGTNEMRFYRVESLDDFEHGAFGLLEPRTACTPLESAQLKDALCLVPGLAFTEDGTRLGWGKGYYDVFLTQNPVCTVGLAFDVQIVKDIPADPHDRRMDFLLTETRFLDCARQRKGSIR